MGNDQGNDRNERLSLLPISSKLVKAGWKYNGWNSSTLDLTTSLNSPMRLKI